MVVVVGWGGGRQGLSPGEEACWMLVLVSVAVAELRR